MTTTGATIDSAFAGAKPGVTLDSRPFTSPSLQPCEVSAVISVIYRDGN